MPDLPGQGSALSDPGVRVTFLGTLVNALLIMAKLIGGFFTGSIALIADGIHSGSDLATDLVVIGGIRLGTRKADANHAYGHGRYETLAGGIVAGALVLIGLYIAWEAGSALYSKRVSYPGFLVILIAAGSIIAKEWIARRTLRVARKEQSLALRSNAWHHRSDALSSVAVLLGGACSLLGWGHADQVAGIIVGGMVIGVGVHTVRDVFHEILEGGLARDELEKIQAAVSSIPQVRNWHKLRTRRVGRKVFIDMHILVDPNLSVLEGHRISMQVEAAVKNASRQPVNVLIHVEPDIPELASHDKED